jgi:hypothetical protein
MPRCEISLHLEKTDVTYHPGEAVRGEVRVVPSSDSDVECRRLGLTFRWRVHGKTWMEGPATTRELFQGTWAGGKACAYPFELVAPPGPPTYHGTLFSVDHYLTVEADLAPANVETSLPEAEILLPPTDGTQYDFGSTYVASSGGTIEAPGAPFSWWILSPFALACGGMAFVQHPALGITFAVVVASLVTWSWWRRRAVGRVGVVLVSREPDPVRIGGEIAVGVDIRPDGRIVLKEARARLVGREKVSIGTGTDRITPTRDVHSGGWVVLAGDAGGSPEQPLALHGTLSVPKYAPPTFLSPDSELTWRVELSMQIEGAPEWQGGYGITVRP